MRIEYTNRLPDVVLFNAVHQFLSPVFQTIYVGFFFLVFYTESESRLLPTAAKIALLWYIGAWLFQFALNTAFLASKKNRVILTTHVIEVREDGLFEETVFNRSLFFWPGVVKAVARPGFVAVYIAAHQAHVIPRRAFATRAERMRFLELVSRHIKAHTTKV
jgi:hypothetical protein